jgi:hypothetical protein
MTLKYEWQHMLGEGRAAWTCILFIMQAVKVKTDLEKPNIFPSPLCM